MKLSKYSIGVGDRFAREAEAQLQACMLAVDQGVLVTPVWNKSHREHKIVGSTPESARKAADEAVRKLSWSNPYFVDADHVNRETADGYTACCDFFTIDVADFIGMKAPAERVDRFVGKHPELVDAISIPGIAAPLDMPRALLTKIASHYLQAVDEASRVYRLIADAKGEEGFITEVSVDETDSPQVPADLLVILAALADEGVPVQTIAPKFTGRFNKGVDYAGDPAQFAREFRDDLAVISYAIDRYGLPEDLKLSVHSGSDKFSLYPIIRKAITATGAGVHLKTAGTTWLEEVIGLAEGGGEGLAYAKEIYARALSRRDDLCAPYLAVIDIDPSRLPSVAEVTGWPAERFAAAVRHDPACAGYNPDMRQLLHVAYKIAAEIGIRFTDLLHAYRAQIAANVTDNLWRRHIAPLFVEND